MKNLKIRTKIILAFAAVIAISVVMSVFAISRVVGIGERTDVVADNYAPSVAALSGIQTRTFNIVTLLVRHAASSDQGEMTALEAQMNALRDENTKSYQLYESFPSGDEERALYAATKGDRQQFWVLHEQIRQLSRQGTPAANAKAADLVEHQLLPVMTRYSDELQKVVDINNHGSVVGLKEVKSSVSATIIGLIIGLVLCVLLATAISILIARAIAGPLRQAVDALEQVAAGDLTASLQVESRDEVGQMADALNLAVDKLRTALQNVWTNADNTNASASELAAATAAIASGAQEQAASLEETSASLEQITATVRQSADNARQASQRHRDRRMQRCKGRRLFQTRSQRCLRSIWLRPRSR
ncbi:methyl-accepting chemotaxis protein, partial [Silvibacterium sp.]|uniref:methyl-accepting chemotaxis protein n=1 Tax=Silvibacterium sp. TaxID=1964179 RepID=UPI0039E2D886